MPPGPNEDHRPYSFRGPDNRVSSHHDEHSQAITEEHHGRPGQSISHQYVAAEQQDNDRRATIAGSTALRPSSLLRPDYRHLSDSGPEAEPGAADARSSEESQSFNFPNTHSPMAHDGSQAASTDPLLLHFSSDAHEPRYANIEDLKGWIPAVAHKKPPWYMRRATLLFTNIMFAVTTLIVNSLSLAYFPGFRSPNEDMGTLGSGNCDKVKRNNALIHVAINILSTLLLAASNFSMQILVAPTRQQINEAHKERKWLQVGVPSVRNLPRIGWARRFLWVVMALSSLPVHFLYNAVVYTTVPTNNYMWAVVDNSFLNNVTWNSSTVVDEFSARVNRTSFVVAKDNDATKNTNLYNQSATEGYPEAEIREKLTALTPSRRRLIDNVQQQANNKTAFHRLEPADCLLRYNRYLANNSHVLLVSSEADQRDSNNSLIWWGFEDLAAETDLSSYWMYEKTNNFSYASGSAFEYRYPGDSTEERLAAVKLAVKGWNVATYKIDYCLASQRSLDHMCVLSYSPPLLIVICVASGVKLLGLIVTAGLAMLPKEGLLLTLGDAIQSFMKDPDDHTKYRCTMDKYDVLAKDPIWTDDVPEPRAWKPRSSSAYKLREGASLARWCWTVALYAANWLVVIAMMAFSIAALRSSHLPTDIKRLFWYQMNIRDGIFLIRGKAVNLPIKSASTSTMEFDSASFNILQGRNALLVNILFANYPQFFISTAGLLINSLFTTLYVAKEWAKFAVEPAVPVKQWSFRSWPPRRKETKEVENPRERKTLRVSSPCGLQRGTYFLSLPLRISCPVIAFFIALHWFASQSVAVINIKSKWEDEDIGRNTTVSACYHNPGMVILGEEHTEVSEIETSELISS
ncbi:hypothetical protein Q7P37_000352 [Cladosporium fusiforme]